MRPQPNRYAVAILIALLSVLSTAATCNKQVTTENSVEGKIAVHATKATDAVRAITDAVKGLEAAGTIPTPQAAAVIKVATEINGHTVTLADLLAAYDSLTPAARDSVTGTQALDKIREQLTRIGNLSAVLLVPIASEPVRQQIGTLVGTLNQSLTTLSIELAKGVR